MDTFWPCKNSSLQSHYWSLLQGCSVALQPLHQNSSLSLLSITSRSQSSSSAITPLELSPCWNYSHQSHYWLLLQGCRLAHQLLNHVYSLTFLKLLSLVTLLIITSSSQSTTWALTQWLLSHRAETPSSHIIDHYFKVAVQHFSYYTMYTLWPFWNPSLWWHYWSLLQVRSLPLELLHNGYSLTVLKLPLATLLIITSRS